MLIKAVQSLSIPEYQYLEVPLYVDFTGRILRTSEEVHVCILPVEVLFITFHVLLHLQLQNQGQQQQTQQQQSVLNTHSTISQSSSNSIASAETHNQSRPSVATRTTLEPNGIRPRKPCNCTKSQCLKL